MVQLISPPIYYLSTMKQSALKSKYSPTERAQISYVQFTTLSQEQIESISVTEINDEHLYSGEKPTNKSPNDLKLGISCSDQKCQTCGQTKQCQGHFGFIRLAEPIYHYGFLKYVEKILKCVCHTCARVKRPNTDYQWKKFHSISRIERAEKKLNEMAKLLKDIKMCPPNTDDKGELLSKNLRGCQSRIPTKICVKEYKIYAQDLNQYSVKSLKIYERGQVKRILEQLSKNKQDCKLLGFTVTKPIDLMIRSLAVAPPQIRPSIQMNPQRKAQDDITSTYIRIINLNKDILHQNLQYIDKMAKISDLEKLVASIMIKLDRNARTLETKRKGVKNIKSISDRLKGKEGRFRQNLMGKRVDFSARSVVSPDSNLALDQLGVPERIAKRLTVPEEITKWNYDKILQLCKEGKISILLKPAEDRLRDDDIPIRVEKLEDGQIEKYLNYGMIAERCLQNGDYVLFNRQPTLHRMSMMAHRVKILPYNTFRLNLSVCTPYNADFDGDEMNMHVPQSFQTISELKNIAHVPKQIIAPKNNSPVMGIVQDALLGIFLFTMRDNFLNREEVMNLMVWIEGQEQEMANFQNYIPGQLPIPAILKPQPLWTGKQIMSLIIPKKITIQILKGKDKNQSFQNVKDASMFIRKGQLLSGALQKEIVGSGAGGLVHSIWLEIGPDTTNQFITITQRIVNNWLISNGFSVGASDIVPEKKFQKIINHEKNIIENIYYKIFNQYRNKEEIQDKNLHQKGKKIMDSYEYNINANLNNRLGKAQQIVKEKVSPYSNNIFKMVTAKSKGSETNLAQIMFLVGNQNIDGKRCPLGFSKRALPHFCKDGNSPSARGFVLSSFYQGLKPHEFFFHAMGGRQGLSDTAVKTSRTGYIQRKLMKSLEDIVVKYDGTVRDSKNNFVQKLYGQDGFIAEFIEKHKFASAQLSEEDFRARYRWQENELITKYGYKPDQVVKMIEEYQKIKQGKQRMRNIFIQGKDITTIEYYCPIKIDRLINKIKAINYGYNQDSVDPLLVYERIEKLLEKCIPSQSAREYAKILEEIKTKNPQQKKINEKIKHFERQNGLQIFRIHLRHNLSSKVLCQSVKLSKAAFTGLVEEIQNKFFQSLASPGECIGSIAAQSIGEPTTQMTLNTFHLAGVSDRNVTLGVPRLQQLLDASKNIKTPSMTIHLKNKILFKDKSIPENQKRILQISEFHLPERTIKHYIEASRFYYDPDPSNSKAGFMTNQHNEKKKTPWVINLQFSHKSMIKRLWEEIWNIIEENAKQTFQIQEHVEFNEAAEDGKNPQIILRLYESAETKSAEKQVLSFLTKQETNIKNLSVGGILGIKSVKTNKKLFLNVPQNVSVSLSDNEKKQFEYLVFETDGSNLKKCLQHPLFDHQKTSCNDLNETYQVLGVQAARQAFINEFKEILKPYGIYVNSRHLLILTDWMSLRGFITPINRNGINRVKDISVLRKASYEQTAQMLFGAAVFSERDYLKGISERVIFGQSAQIGTSSLKIMIDHEKVGNYVSKAELDKKELKIEKESDLNGVNSFMGDKTPINPWTPYQEAGKSVWSQRSPFGMSPAFTPMRKAQFTPNYEFDGTFSAQRSPGQTPLPMRTPLQHTPTYASQMGLYGSPVGGSSYRVGGNSSSRSPYYPNSNSPNYSSVKMSESPNYNSPLKSAYSSPNYGSVKSNSDRQPNFKKEEDEEDEEDF